MAFRRTPNEADQGAQMSISFDGKSRRRRERLELSLPARVFGRESEDHEWVEQTRLLDVTPFGVRFSLSRPTEPGRLLHLTLPMPRQLRCFDHIEDQYRVWSVVCRITVAPEFGAEGGEARFEVGVAFTGKNPPASYIREPTTLYEVDSLSAEDNLWKLREVERAGPASRSEQTRLRVAIPVTVEVFDEDGRVAMSEQTVTENLSPRGAAVWTTLKGGRRRFVRLTSSQTGMSVRAALRAPPPSPHRIPRPPLEFIDKRWPLEGIE